HRQRETAELAAVQSVNGSGAAGDVPSLDEQHQHIVDTVAVQTLGSGTSLHTRPRLDPELVNLDLPRGRFRCKIAEQRPAALENRPHRRAPAGLGRDWREPASDAAVQRVVLEALIVWLMRLADNRAD